MSKIYVIIQQRKITQNSLLASLKNFSMKRVFIVSFLITCVFICTTVVMSAVRDSWGWKKRHKLHFFTSFSHLLWPKGNHTLRCNNSSFYFISVLNYFIIRFIVVGRFHTCGRLRFTTCWTLVIAKGRENIIRFIRRDFRKVFIVGTRLALQGFGWKLKSVLFLPASSVPAAVPAGERRLHLPPVVVRKTHSRHRGGIFLRRRLHSEGGLQVSHVPVWGMGQPAEAQLPLGTRWVASGAAFSVRSRCTWLKTTSRLHRQRSSVASGDAGLVIHSGVHGQLGGAHPVSGGAVCAPAAQTEVPSPVSLNFDLC